MGAIDFLKQVVMIFTRLIRGSGMKCLQCDKAIITIE